MKDPKIGPKIIISMMAYTAIFLIGMALIAYNEITQPPHQGVIPTIIQILIKGQAAAIVAGGAAISVETGAYIVVLASYLINKINNEREKAVAQAVAEGRAEGIAEGKSQGKNMAYQRANTEFAAYMQRMRAAQESGEPFNESPPYFPTDEED